MKNKVILISATVFFLTSLSGCNTSTVKSSSIEKDMKHQKTKEQTQKKKTPTRKSTQRYMQNR